MSGRRPPCSSSVSRRGLKRRSGPEHRRQGKQGRFRGHGSRAVDADVLDVNNVVAALPQAPQGETGPDSAEFVMDETGLASEEAVAHRSGPQQEVRVEANARQPAPRTELTREFSSKQRSRNLPTVPVVEDGNQHEVLESQSMQFRFTEEEKLDYPAAPPTLHRENPRATEIRHIELPKLAEDHNLRAKQAAAAATQTEPAAGARSLLKPSRPCGKPNSSTLRTFFLRKKKFSSPISYKVPENYSRPPHPYDVGKVSHVNICPVCEKYTVIELDGSTVPSTTPDETTLRARFKCGLCQEVFDLGISQFDPRGIPGVTLYEGEDRFQPPVPPREKYPCPRCWKNTHTSFQCMTLYLREESKLQCESACPAERLKELSSSGKPEETEIEARNIIQTVLGLF